MTTIANINIPRKIPPLLSYNTFPQKIPRRHKKRPSGKRLNPTVLGYSHTHNISTPPPQPHTPRISTAPVCINFYIANLLEGYLNRARPNGGYGSIVWASSWHTGRNQPTSLPAPVQAPDTGPLPLLNLVWQVEARGGGSCRGRGVYIIRGHRGGD